MPAGAVTLPIFESLLTEAVPESTTTVSELSSPSPHTAFTVSTVAPPTSDHPSPTAVLGVTTTTSTVALSTFNHLSSAGFTNTASSFPPLTSILLIPASTPKSPVTSTQAVLTTFNNTHTFFSSSQTTWVSAPASSVLAAYDPVFTATFSDLQNSLSAIGVSSNILSAEIFLYGAYFVMFGFYLNVLRERGFAKNRGLTLATILLFIFCTVHCALQITTSTLYNRLESTSIGNSESLFDQTLKDYTAFAIATDAVYVTSNVIADAIFILRCYAIWNFQLKIVIFPILLTLAVAGVGYANAFWPLHTSSSLRSETVAEFSFELFKISILLSISTTVILMVLTAGRIWWIGRTARTLLGQTVISKYHTASAMILESGAIYCAGAIAFATIGFTVDQVYSTTGAVLAQLVGIAPTIIAVRVGLGHSVVSAERFGAGMPQGASRVSLLQSHPKSAPNRDEEAHGSSRNYTIRNDTPSTRSLEQPATVLYIRSGA